MVYNDSFESLRTRQRGPPGIAHLQPDNAAEPRDQELLYP